MNIQLIKKKVLKRQWWWNSNTQKFSSFFFLLSFFFLSTTKKPFQVSSRAWVPTTNHFSAEGQSLHTLYSGIFKTHTFLKKPPMFEVDRWQQTKHLTVFWWDLSMTLDISISYWENSFISTLKLAKIVCIWRVWRPSFNWTLFYVNVLYIGLYSPPNIQTKFIITDFNLRENVC